MIMTSAVPAEQHQSALHAFNPSFDIRESQEAFHLHGELPGIAPKDTDIEFCDTQTLIVKGRTEREC
jgi:HSP20 family molecular chaperone IbpA